MKSKLIWILILLLLFVSSYYREVLFKSINAIIEGEEFFYAKTTRIDYLTQWTRPELLKLKYFLTAFFSIFFILITSYGLKFSFKDKFPFQISIITYSIIVILAILIGSFGMVLSTFDQVYPTLRLFVGWIHSPIIFLLLSIGSIGYNNIRSIN